MKKTNYNGQLGTTWPCMDLTGPGGKKAPVFGADKQRLDPETRDFVESTYRKLWPVCGYTPDAERADRRWVDELLERSGLPAP